MSRVRALWQWISAPDSSEVRAASRELARWRVDLLTVMLGPILVIGLAVGGALQLRDTGVTPLLLVPVTSLVVVVAFCLWRWRKWHSTRGHGRGRHRG